MPHVSGLHHVTAIAGPAQENLDFYAGVLGMRLVKKSVNQDDPGTYHLFYADAEGHPGTDLTFFPWPQMAPARPGHGLSTEVALAVPPESLGFWKSRLEQSGAEIETVGKRFGAQVLPFRDPHGLKLALVESERALTRPFTPWSGSPVPAEHQIRGLESARLVLQQLEPTTEFLRNRMGFEWAGEENGWHRWAVGDGRSGKYIDLIEKADAPRGRWGTGGIHHLAWRVADEDQQSEMRSSVAAAGSRVTPVIDRFWFKSIYFPEPGGVLFEVATDGPGFAVDEDAEHLGETLVLPPWLEEQRPAIEAVLPKLRLPPRT